MSKTVQMTFRIDEELKASSSEFFRDCGLSLSQGIQLLLKKTLQEGQILIRPTTYNKETLAAMAESEEIMRHPDQYMSYDSAEEMVSAIIAEDSKC